ncbi:hypothetical protein GGI23_005846 [Coemansia sp. RSA 2559]|nr:hypothetical protein GGI23_005846 [Coemansia sp. RSA 2559]KAJ2865580.1 hypothetical protein GGI22_001475 [Coemansia erecta]
MDAVVSTVTESVIGCITQSMSAMREVEAANAPTRIAHPALEEAATEAEEYETVASLSTAFTAQNSLSAGTEEEENESGFGLDEENEVTINEAKLEPSDVIAAAAAATAMATDATAAATVRSAQIFCLKEDCTINRDWLTSTPNAAAGWASGAIVLVIGIILSVPAVVWRNIDFLDGVLAMVELCIALFLRAAIGKASTATAQGMLYKASLFFNHHAGIELALLLALMAIRLHAHYNPIAASRQVVWASAARFVSVCLAVMILVGVLLMFSGGGGAAELKDAGGPGIHLIQAVTFAVIVIALGLALFAMKLTFNAGLWFYKKHFASLFAPLFLLTLWAAYMSARTLVPLDNVARASEVMFYLLNILPLALIGAVLVALRSPLLFNFEMTAHWKCDA